MRIRDKTQCGNMSDEAIGESKKQDVNHRSPNNKTHPSPNRSGEAEVTPLRGNFRVFKGLKNDHNSHDGERDGLSSPSSPNFSSDDAHTSGGGRLKFFKDGKFILELSHRKDGEKTCWIPVQKKTFWPVIGSPKQESSASLSVSDDNSSIQSSPWQRDHCWKQTSPKRNVSKKMQFYFSIDRKNKSSFPSTNILRRKPFASIANNTLPDISMMSKRRRLPLGRIMQSLWERVMTNTSCKTDMSLVSPRKRILRELERFTLEEATKRQRARAPAIRNSHTISSILAKEGESVLRTLLRSPSPASTDHATRQPAQPVTATTVSTPSSTSSSSSSSAIIGSSPSSAASSAAPNSYLSPSIHNIHPIGSLLGSTANSYYPPMATFPPHMWPAVHDPFSSPPVPFPLYYIPSYPHSWPQVHHRSVPPEPSSDVPLNLSKNPG